MKVERGGEVIKGERLETMTKENEDAMLRKEDERVSR